MLDFITRKAQGHGPVHLLLTSAAELGFAWDGEEKGWVRSLTPLRMMTEPVQHFRSAILDAWRFTVFSKLSERKVFLGGEFADYQGSLQLLISSHLRERDKMLLRAILCGVFATDSFLARPRRKMFLVVFVVGGMVMVTCSGSVLSPPPLPLTSSMFGNFLNLLIFCLWIVATGPVVCFGMVGYLVLVVLVMRTPGLPPLVIWRLFILNSALVLIRWTLMVAGLLLSIGMLMISPQFLDKVYMSIVVSGADGQTVQKTVDYPQLQFQDKVYMPVVCMTGAGFSRHFFCELTGVRARGLRVWR